MRSREKASMYERLMTLQDSFARQVFLPSRGWIDLVGRVQEQAVELGFGSKRDGLRRPPTQLLHVRLHRGREGF